MLLKYILLKENTELKKGAILVEKCSDGMQGFKCEDREFYRFDDQALLNYSRKSVIENPRWFMEVKTLELTFKQYEKVKKILGKEIK